MKKKIIVVCGPTATGKTDLALLLAAKFSGELVNADSRQVYRGMDIITGKDLSINSELRTLRQRRISLGLKNSKLSIGYREKEGIPIWLVDIVNPDYAFNVGEYQKLAHIVIQDILKRKKLPIIVGGTGLYIRSIIESVPHVQIPPNPKLRVELSKLTVEQLQKELQNADSNRWGSMNNSDRANPRRLIRTIEISKAIASSQKPSSKQTNKNSYNNFSVGLTAPREFLFQRIDIRVDQRVQAGAIEELKRLLRKEYSLHLPSMTATGYKELTLYLNDQITISEAVRRWKLSEHAYAKRQMTWFKKVKSIAWFDISLSNYIQKIEDKVKRWYTS